MADLPSQAMKAYIDNEYQLAFELFTQAISSSPTNGELFVHRAQTNIQLRNFTEAVADASRAIELDPSLFRAHFRMGNAFYELKKYQTAKATLEVGLKKYQTAKATLEAGSSLAPMDERFTNLIKRCDEQIAEIHGEILNPPLAKPST